MSRGKSEYAYAGNGFSENTSRAGHNMMSGSHLSGQSENWQPESCTRRCGQSSRAYGQTSPEQSGCRHISEIFHSRAGASAHDTASPSGKSEPLSKETGTGWEPRSTLSLSTEKLLCGAHVFGALQGSDLHSFGGLGASSRLVYADGLGCVGTCGY